MNKDMRCLLILRNYIHLVVLFVKHGHVSEYGILDGRGGPDISGVVVNHRINGYSMNKSFDGYYLTRVGLG